VLAAMTQQQKIGIGIAIVMVVGGLVYLVSSLRRGPGVGAEIEIAPNRRPYLNDDQLEGPKLDRSLTWAMVMLGILAVGLPAYWLREPHRQAGNGFDRGKAWFAAKAVTDGLRLFQAAPGVPPTPREAHFGCETCHGVKGIGGSTTFSILTDPANPKSAQRQVKWQCPPLNTVALRYRDDEIKTIIVYGRQGTPMPPWGVAGGGPMNDQQINDLIAYLHSIALSPKDAQAASLKDYGSTDGKALFDGYCARCHTQGYSYGEPGVEGGGGSLGFSLVDGATKRRFPDIASHVEWVTNTAEFGKAYGIGGISHGVMPHFGDLLSADQIKAIVDYERTL
jgi:mono/diheme cytochrome c family protein